MMYTAYHKHLLIRVLCSNCVRGMSSLKTSSFPLIMALLHRSIMSLVACLSCGFPFALQCPPSCSVTTDQCVSPTLDYNAFTTPGSERIGFIYTMSPFTSSCSGRVVRYWFCYQNTSSTTGGVRIATVLLLEDMGANYQVVAELNVEVMPGEDSCLSASPTDGQCCVTRNLAAESQLLKIPVWSGGPS